MGKDCSRASCPISPGEGGQLTSPTGPLTSILSTAMLFPWVYSWVYMLFRGKVCYFGGK